MINTKMENKNFTCTNFYHKFKQKFTIGFLRSWDHGHIYRYMQLWSHKKGWNISQTLAFIFCYNI